MTHAHAPLTATVALWARIATLLDLFVRAFGTATRLMAQRTLHRRDARDATRWLADIEATVRRLLFAEAATLTLTPARSRAGMAPPQKAAAATAYNPNAYREAMLAEPGLMRIGGFLPRVDDPASWKVSFRLGAEGGASDPAPSGAPPRARPGASGDARSSSSTPVPIDKLARRVEAVRRVIADPHPWIRRLARKLQRQPRLVVRLAQLPQRRWRTPCGAVLDEACAATQIAQHKRE